MFQIKNVTLTHKKDLRTILQDFSLVLNYGDRAVMIGEEGNLRERGFSRSDAEGTGENGAGLQRGTGVFLP